MNEYVATNMGELASAMLTITGMFSHSKPWWRGVASTRWDLVPGVYWKGYTDKEARMFGRFRNMARARHATCPDNQDVLSWLFLMQHYRLPTRLLDWSESPLVALYFAVESEAENLGDAVLWALLPTGLNLDQRGKEDICLKGHVDLSRLSAEAFVKDKSNPDRRIISVLTEQCDLRHMIQQSAFTIHGCGTPINKLPNADKYLAWIRIPQAAKPALRQILDICGISRAALFPDLENLALDIASTEFTDNAEP